MQETSHTNLKNIKNKIFILFLCLLCIPMFQFVLPFMDEKPLDGIDPPKPLPVFTIDSWLNEEYQKAYSPAFEQNIGFHNFFVRLKNQFNFSVLGFVDVGDVIVGKENFIYLKSYVDAYTGADFVGQEYIDIQSQKIKVLQTELKKKNIDLIIVFAPGKASFYPEYLPSRFRSNQNTNYACYKQAFSNNKIPFLDLHASFLAKKNFEKYPLFSNTGVHWTQYGCTIAGTEIVSFIEKTRKIKLPEIQLVSLELASFSGSYSNDYDAACLMNVLTTIPHPKYAIPKLQFNSTSQTVRPRFTCISDSYFAGIVKTGIPSAVFTDYHYWLYNKTILPESELKEKFVSEINLKCEIEKQDVICILASDVSLGQFPFGFVDKAYELYAKKDSNYFILKNKEFKSSIIKIIENINKNKEWKSNLIENAKRKGISVTDEFILNAIWIYEQEQIELKK